jgi:hypothetical protein
MYTSPVRIPATIPTVPLTPGPRSMDQIHNDAKMRFAGIIWIQKEPNRNLEDYFSSDDHWEPYSETTIYSKRTYQAAYKGVMRDYNNFLCILESDEGSEYFVVAKRVRNELEELEPYCPCITCSSSRCNPLKYLWCPHCTRCLKAGSHFVDKEYVEQARVAKQQKDEKKKTPGKYDRYINLISSVRTIEMMIGGIIGLVGLYYCF